MNDPPQPLRRIYLTEDNIGTKVLIGDNQAVIAKPEESVDVQLIVSLPDAAYNKIGIVSAFKQPYLEVMGHHQDGTPICKEIVKYNMILGPEDIQGSMCPHIRQYIWYI